MNFLEEIENIKLKNEFCQDYLVNAFLDIYYSCSNLDFEYGKINGMIMTFLETGKISLSEGIKLLDLSMKMWQNVKSSKN